MLEKINSLVWGPATIILVLGTGIFFTVKLNFFQFRNLKTILRQTIFCAFKDKSKSFGAVTTALAGTIGTGNIAGVATSIALGGPGAVFWMILSAFFCMMTKYAEVYLAVKFQTKNKSGECFGGPMVYMDKILGVKSIAIIFSVFVILSSFGVGNMVQSNSVSQALSNVFSVSPENTGIALAILCFFVIIGGSKKISSATQIIVPVMAVFYLLGTIIFIIINIKNVPSVIYKVLIEAFDFKSLGGGVGGFVVSKTIKYGVSRGIFTNEAGMGSSPIAYGCSESKNSPHEQGLWGIFEVFFDTVIMCTLTALVILTAADGVTAKSGLSGINLTIAAFETIFDCYGGMFISISMIFFAVATILGWCFYGEKAMLYLTNENKTALFIYKIFYISAIYIGSILSLNVVWTLSDIFNGLMLFPNIISLLILNKHIKRGP